MTLHFLNDNYARLSTLIGVTWIFGFINLLIRHDILEYLFIVLNASQGDFIIKQRGISLKCHVYKR